LIFIIYPDRINISDDSGNYITDYYIPILRKIKSKSILLLITKSDKLYTKKQIDKQYDKFKKYVISEIEIREHFYTDIKGRAKAVLPVFINVKDDEPLTSNGKLRAFGFYKVLDVMGKWAIKWMKKGKN
jgi:hypothetical protein